jgi:hypothetical protein
MVGATRESIALALSRLVSAGIAERNGMTFLIEPRSLYASLRGNGNLSSRENGDRVSPIPVQRELSPS